MSQEQKSKEVSKCCGAEKTMCDGIWCDSQECEHYVCCKCGKPFISESSEEKKPKCEYCYDKGYYSQMKGTIGSDDFGGEGFEVKPTIHKIPCPKCFVPESSEKKKELTRCGACGDFQENPSFYTEEEQNNAKLIHCGCEKEKEPRFVTRDMAIDAGDLSLEGQRYE